MMPCQASRKTVIESIGFQSSIPADKQGSSTASRSLCEYSAPPAAVRDDAEDQNRRSAELSMGEGRLRHDQK